MSWTELRLGSVELYSLAILLIANEKNILIYIQRMFINTTNFEKKILDPVLILSAGFVGGYTLSMFPKQFLNLLTNPIGQFIAYLIILYIYYKDDVKPTELVLEAIFYVVVIQVVNYMLHKIFKNSK